MNDDLGLGLLSDPDVARDFIADVNRLMKRNCELYGALTRAEHVAEDMYRMLLRGQRDAAMKLYEVAYGDPCS